MPTDIFEEYTREVRPDLARPAPAARVQLRGAQVDDLSADEAARQAAWARTYGVTPEIVSGNPAVFKDREETDKLDRTIKASPEVAKWASKNRHNAAMSRDDLSTLAEGGAIFRQRQPRKPVWGRLLDSAKGTIDSFARGFDSAIRDPLLPKARAVASDLTWSGAGNSLLAGVLDLGAGAAGVAAALPEGVVTPFSPALGQAARPALEIAGRLVQREADEIAPDAETSEASGIYSGIRSVPASVASLFGGVALRSATAGAALMGASTGGSSYLRGREEGLSREAAQIYATIDAGIEYATEVSPLERLIGGMSVGDPFLKRLIRSTLAEIPGEQVATFGQDFNAWAMIEANQGKTFSDFLAERPEAAYQTLWASIVTSGAVNIAAEGLQQAARRMGRDFEGSLQSEEDARMLELLAQVASVSKVAQRDPGSFEDFIREASDGSGAEHVFVDANILRETFDQSGITPEEAAELTGVSPQEFDQAVETGADLRIPVETYAARLSQSDIGPALLDHLRIDPDALSRAEAQEFLKGAGEELQTLAQAEVANAQARDERLVSRDAVRDALHEQLNNAGRFTSDTNFAYATLHSHILANLAEREGITAEELAQRYGLIVQTGEVAEPTFDQPESAAFQNWFGDSQAVDAEGRPLTLYHGTGQDIDAFSGMTWGSVTPALAGEYAAMREVQGEGEGRVMPLFMRAERPFDADLGLPRTVTVGSFFNAAVEQAQEQGRDVDLDAVRALVDEISAAAKREESGPHYNRQDFWNDTVSSFGKDGAEAIRRAFEVLGFDSVKMLENGELTFGVFSPEQVKSVDNRGTFDRSDPRILFQSTINLNLTGLPENSPGAFAPARQAAHKYMMNSGLPYSPPRKYVKIKRARAEAIAAAYEAMEHNPEDPDVRAAYEALAEETLAQWAVIRETGLVVEFNPEPNKDPYGGSPWGAVHDVRDNNHMFIFPTEEGYGQDGITAQDERENPMLAIVPGELWNGRQVRVNDIFRAVHDYFGHIADGVGFRAAGEENAWRAHAAMFSPLARRALTSETRGQNSWLNYGPHGERNRKASVEDTVFAEQKIGLLPDWVVEDGRTDAPTTPGLARQTMRDLKALAAETPMSPERMEALYRDTLTRDVRVQKDGHALVLSDSPTKVKDEWWQNKIKGHDAEFVLHDDPRWIAAHPVYQTQPPVNLDGTISLQHYGVPGLERTDPNRWGASGDFLPKSERERVGKDAPRTYFGIATGTPGGYVNEFAGWAPTDPRRPSQSSGRVLYETRIPAGRLYDMQSNPDNLTEQGVIDAGYAGFWVSNPQLGLTAIVFEPTEVVQVPVDDVGQILYQSPVFYSALGRAIGDSKTNRAPAQQWIATLKKAPGVTADELEWSGIEDFLNMQEGPVTREQLLELVQNGGIKIEETLLGEEGDPETHFQSWSSDPTNPTYRELLLRLPAGQGTNPDRSPGTHWDDEAVVAHARFREAVDTEGNKVLFIEEVQSDWHQKGRDQGYAKPVDDAEVARARVALGEASENELSARGDWEQEFTALLQTFDPDEQARIEWSPRNPGRAMRAMREVRVERLEGEPDAIRAQYAGVNAAYSTWQQANLRFTEANAAYIDATNQGQGIPDAPFRTSWPALVMKRMIRWAVDNGYQKIAWTTGAQQAERYNLSQSVGDLSATLLEDGEYLVALGQTRAARTLHEQGLASEAPEPEQRRQGMIRMTEAQLAEAFGKDVAQRIVDGAAEGFDARGERNERLTAAEDARDAARDAIEEYEQALRDQAIEALVNDVTPGLEGLTPERLRETAVIATRGSSNESLIRTLGWDEEQAAAWQAGLDALWNDLTALRAEVANAQSQIGADVTLQDEDLTVGGEGMKGFYDRNLVNITNKLIKKSGARVGPVAIQDIEGPNTRQRSGIEAEIQRTAGLTAYGLRTVADAEARAAELEAQGPRLQGDADRLRAAIPLIAELEALPGGETQPGFEITPELAAQARGGFAMFQRTGQPRGQIALPSDLSSAPAVITLLRGADLSTFLHESGHFYWEIMTDLAAQPGASEDIRADVQTMLDFVGVPTLADWQRMGTADKRPAHEKIARAFEAYLFEGQSPNTELDSLFGRFSRWLRAVYTSLTKLDVTLSDEVRGVFDRLIASEDQIAEAQISRGMEPMFTDRPEGVGETEWAGYQREQLEATEQAVNELAARSLRDMQFAGRAIAREIKRLQRENSENRKTVKEEVADEIEGQPLYRAIRFMRTGKPDAASPKVEGPFKMYTPEVRAALQLAEGEPLPAALNGMTSAQNGIHPAQVADMFGYSSADHLIRELLFATPLPEAIEAETDLRMRERFGELNTPEQLQEAAAAAVHNAVRGRFVATELAMLQRAPGKRRALTAAARKLARETIDNTRLRNIRPGQYEAGERRAGRLALQTRDNVAEAAHHKRNQLLQFHLAREAHAARDEAEKIRKYLRKFDNTTTRQNIDKDFLDQIDALLEAVQLRPISDIEAQRRKDMAAWIAEMEEEGFEPAVSPEYLAEINRRAFRDLTMDEIRQLNDAVRNIEWLGRRTKELLTARDKAEVEAAAQDVADAIRDNAHKTVELPVGSPTWGERSMGYVRGFFASLRKMGNVVFTFDGNQYGGHAWERLMRPLNEAADREATMNAQATRRLQNLFARLGGTDLHTRTFEPAIGKSISMETRLMVALNMGNSANVQRLVDGDGWSLEQLQAIIAPLDSSHWDWVESVWSFVDSYWPQINAKNERVTGIPLEKVEAEPFQVEIDGELRLVRGGYFPIKYDPDRSQKAGEHDQGEVAAQLMRGAYTRATTRRGHTKERVSTVVERPLRKDFGVIFDHTAQVIHDLTHHEALIDVNRILKHRGVNNAIRDHYGPEMVQQMNETIRDVAAGRLAEIGRAGHAATYLRSGLTITAMGWNFFEAIQNTTGIFQSMQRVGTAEVLGGIWEWLGNPAQANEKLAWIREQSPFMENRLSTFQRDLNELRNNVGQRGPLRTYLSRKFPSMTDRVADGLIDSFFYMSGKTQLLTDVPTWIGQYNKSMAAGETHERAVSLADQAVVDSQSSGLIKDLSGAQRDRIFQFFTSFYGFFSATYNMNVDRISQARREGVTPSLFVDMLMINMAPALASTLLFTLFRGDDDDWEELPSTIAKDQVSFIVAQFPLLREGLAFARGQGPYTGPASMRFFTDVNRFGTQAMQGEVDEPFLRALNATMGALLRYPSGQVDKTFRGIKAVSEGEAGPQAVIFGPPPK